MSKPLVHFVHGKESGPWGSKITYLAELAHDRGCEVASLDYSGIDDPARRTDKLVAACAGQPVLALVGSSMGGWVATAASLQVVSKGLFLLAPAFYLPGYPATEARCTGENIEVVHGWDDEVILYEHSVRFAVRQRCTLHLVADGHRLQDQLPLIGNYFGAFIDRLLAAE